MNYNRIHIQTIKEIFINHDNPDIFIKKYRQWLNISAKMSFQVRGLMLLHKNLVDLLM